MGLLYLFFHHLKSAYEVPNQTAPNQIAMNRPIQSQTKASTAKSSCEIDAVLGHYAAEWQFITDVSRQPIKAIFKGQEIRRREQSMTEVT